ncbi:Fe-S cluster assembly protein SufB [Porphyromonas levii]|uniref:Fe-S cluster assembly protein SufB n=1 Tax=Porphyromonas levii TaxID=28114 RepID=A0A4Y8WR49_9PORP|nr:Fe-S cluster assembly protein SufB [Porphyromonas levii]MBR8704185.1 FeS cluster assembly protein SufB [Porphyromonas levii]MBR8729984.1 FeS cluster assembly protein SufB [Porphyromonas levii]MBR8732331.1 FeS cluster assembly protein SufB [Porphyromonas levii]MBR8760323.1 FeS cluster assembly protein SufB [Porphyromonas levii]MBR8764166.1 FeS cluster assembly protein SufB [Porphyromonas levii]
MSENFDEIIDKVTQSEYEYGWTTNVETEYIPKGLSEDTIRLISQKKREPEWMLEHRLDAYRHWLTLEMPDWAHLDIPEIDFQEVIYFAQPKKKKSADEEMDPELERTFEKLGIPVNERKALAGYAVDAVVDSSSVRTTFKETLAEKGIIFMSFSEALQEYPELIQKYLGTVVGYRDNFFAALNAAVFSDGSFVYVPKGVRCPMELSTYFRINAMNTGQFERTLIVADEGAYVSYLEGCTAPMRDENQLHAAVVEIIAETDAEVKYSTVQNWYPGDKDGKGGIYNFVTKRGICRGDRSKISWTQVETGSAITWKYPSCILQGNDSVAEFYSVAVTNNFQQADTGTKMIHLGKNTKSRIVSKGISAGRSENSYRGLVKISSKAENARNHSQCDSLLIGDKCGAHTFPYAEVHNSSSIIEHEATTSKISEDQLFYCQQRGIPEEEAVGLIINGYAKEVMNHLPMEFAVEAQKLLSISLEGSVG